MNMGFKVVGVDYYFETLTKFKNQYEEAILINANAEFLPLKASIFNCVIAVQIVDLVSNHRIFFREVKRILKPGGLLLITFTNKSSIKSIAHKLHIIGRNKDRRLFYVCNYPEIVEEIHLSELQVINAWGYNWNLLLRDNDTVLVDLFAMVEKLFRLKYLPYISPWVFIVAKKSS
jgi:SAM-dependent methyltransferase